MADEVAAIAASPSASVPLVAWAWLLAAIVLEVSGTVCMKYAQGFTRLWPSLGVVVFYALSIVMMTFAQKRMPLSIMYAVWSGLGTALIAVIGMVWLREPVNVWKIVSLACIVGGVIGLNLSGGETH